MVEEKKPASIIPRNPIAWYLLVASAVPLALLAGVGITRGLEAWINYHEPPARREVYFGKNGRPSYEVVWETPTSDPITNYYARQKIVGPLPIRRGPRD